MNIIKPLLITSMLIYSQAYANPLETFIAKIKPTAKTVANGGSQANCEEHYQLGKPIVIKEDKEKVEKRSFYLCRLGYAIQFDPAYKTALWSAEDLTADRMDNEKEERTDNFQPDPEVPYAAQATLNDYKRTHFDRGHLSPAADMKLKDGVVPPNQQKIASEQIMSQSFYLTNMVPQVGPNQNRGIWADLEKQVRKWAKDQGHIAVVSGPIYDNGFQTIGSSKVAIPTRLYKVIINVRTYETIAFIIPNVQIATKKTRKLDEGNPDYPQTTPQKAINCGNSCSISNFVTTVSDVEKLSGLRFFSKLNDSDHSKVIKNVNISKWSMK